MQAQTERVKSCNWQIQRKCVGEIRRNSLQLSSVLTDTYWKGSRPKYYRSCLMRTFIVSRTNSSLSFLWLSSWVVTMQHNTRMPVSVLRVEKDVSDDSVSFLFIWFFVKSVQSLMLLCDVRIWRLQLFPCLSSLLAYMCLVILSMLTYFSLLYQKRPN